MKDYMLTFAIKGQAYETLYFDSKEAIAQFLNKKKGLKWDIKPRVHDLKDKKIMNEY